MVPIQVTSAPQIRAFPKLNANRDQVKQIQGPAVTVFVGMCIVVNCKCTCIKLSVFKVTLLRGPQTQ